MDKRAEPGDQNLQFEMKNEFQNDAVGLASALYDMRTQLHRAQMWNVVLGSVAATLGATLVWIVVLLNRF